MNLATIKRLILFCLLGLGLFALAGMHPAHATAAPLLQTSCTLPATVTTADDLYDCIIAANAGSGGTITLGADINLTMLTTGPLPSIRSTIVLQGAGYAIDGGGSVQIFDVNEDGELTVNQATLQNVSGNTAALYNEGGTVTVTNSTFSGNVSSGFGAAIFSTSGNSFLSGTLTVSNSTFIGNSGGAIYSGSGSTLTVSNSTFTGNSGFAGGAIYNSGGPLTVSNSTFTGNSGGTGGAIYNNGGIVTATSNTFTGNSANNLGGAIYNTGFGWQLYVAGNIFAAGPSGANCEDSGGPINDNGYNLSDDATCTDRGTGSANNVTLNLGALANNGGDTQTHLPGAGSAARGAIPNGTILSNNGTSWTCNQTFTDQRGESRPLSSGDDCTAGAVEVAPLCPSSWAVMTADELYHCILKANGNESPSPTADTITLGADIDLTTLTTSLLPQITSEITVEGAGHFIDGGNNRRIFNVGTAGDLTVKQATLQNGRNGNSGGAVSNDGALTLINSTLSGSAATTGIKQALFCKNDLPSATN